METKSYLQNRALPSNAETERGELFQSNEKSCAFHIHLDGAVLPPELESYAKEKYSFFDDDFDHRLVIRNQATFRSTVARQLTLKIMNPLARKQVRAICSDLEAQAEKFDFAGIIQSEYVMSETLLSSRIRDYEHVSFPFYVHMRRINRVIGEEFKSHELHLEFTQELTDPRLITEIARSGMNVTFGPCEITFTASGYLNDVKNIETALLSYLKKTRGYDKATLTLEATVFHSIHQMNAEDTPLIVSRLEYLQ